MNQRKYSRRRPHFSEIRLEMLKSRERKDAVADCSRTKDETTQSERVKLACVFAKNEMANLLGAIEIDLAIVHHTR